MPGHGSTVTHGRISRSQVQHERTAGHLRGESCTSVALGFHFFFSHEVFLIFGGVLGHHVVPKFVGKILKRAAGDYASFENL